MVPFLNSAAERSSGFLGMWQHACVYEAGIWAHDGAVYIWIARLMLPQQGAYRPIWSCHVPMGDLEFLLRQLHSCYLLVVQALLLHMCGQCQLWSAEA
jgi:hypothetical protein